ncbi:transport and Golgi organization protein 6 homolog isoform X10 [Equus asinus]|uniref:transport and Golgi organization protein 6 homolog isoform X10 n=1 Tax=Equus asinus TaxID=9793 RepID=UPI0038F7F9CE
MSDWIFYINSNLSSVPWEGNGAAAVAPTTPPTPCLYHVLYRGCGETQMGWHGETYCLVGGCRACGDAPVATPEKVEAEKPVPRRGLKRPRAVAEPDEDLGCPKPKIRRLQHGGRRQTLWKLAG